jgi:hypothetical protein
MDEVIGKLFLAFSALQTSIARLSAIESSDDALYIIEETADFFSVWLRNVTPIQEGCSTFDHCLRNNSELKATLAELLMDVRDDLAEG